ncbi:MAG TPA: LysM peptidoglycan-binding domain-containing protein [Candidatus Thiothrix moscowensis]|uniref:LysM peptidoglycan-binding domain-containing protein n=1 Tax=unclassified Thiothrix TaxID=2636184 RepID=UPI0025D005FF|nr:MULTISPECIES: LysM peptidoglycan-binding domain-containing protein [unclassified Thiothrix]HRJ52603.1 LysM peptidoglycan-binding domain-containing protein [Candidatus Thiothrix moscowensis]HRJ92913.1 LysM peptidoglycan-binding domain-containing protein [Candidatus Thiothrix moscowensis]
MRRSSPFFWQSVLISTASALVLSACGASTPAKSGGSDPYDRYYGSPQGQDVAGDTIGYGDIIVNPAAPQTYVVQKGDTLWGIARKFLNTPWHWPEVWDKNQRIPNPHLIYPGDVLTLDYVQGSGAGNKLVPRIRVDRGGREGQPISSLIPFMAWPRVLDEATINNAPYIMASRDDHALIAEGETIYVRNLRNAVEGSRCAVFHKNKPLLDTNGSLLGYEVTYAGYSRVERLGEPATATVLDAQREIRKGDRLLQPLDETEYLNTPIHAPASRVRGDVVAMFDAEAVAGNYMIATINKGLRDNIQVGHVLGIYAGGKTVDDPYLRQQTGKMGISHPVSTQLPPEKVANLVIYKVTDKVSYGLILDATREVKNGYKIGNP